MVDTNFYQVAENPAPSYRSSIKVLLCAVLFLVTVVVA